MEIRVGGRLNYNWKTGQLDYGSMGRKKEGERGEGRWLNDFVKFVVGLKRTFQ